MKRQRWMIGVVTCVATVLLSGCAAGVRLYDEPKANLTAEIKQSYEDANVLAVIETERQNLANLLAEEIKTVRTKACNKS